MRSVFTQPVNLSSLVPSAINPSCIRHPASPGASTIILILASPSIHQSIHPSIHPSIRSFGLAFSITSKMNPGEAAATASSPTLHEHALRLVGNKQFTDVPAFIITGPNGTIKASSSRSDLDRRSSELAHSLRHLVGVDKLDLNPTQKRQRMQELVVSVVSPITTIEYAETLLAASKAGIVLGSVPGKLAANEIFQVQKHSCPSIVIFNYLSLDKIAQVVNMGGFANVCKFIVWGNQQQLESCREELDQLPSCVSFDELIENSRKELVSPGEFDWGRSTPEEIFGLFLTSGSTGMPKLVELPHRRMLSGGPCPEEGDIRSGSMVVDMSFCYPFGGLFAFGAIHAGLRALVMEQHGSDDDYVAVLKSFRPEHLLWMPNSLMSMITLDQTTVAPFKEHLKSITYGGATFPLPALIKAMRLFGPERMRQVYGSTECGLLSILRPEDHVNAWNDIQTGLDISSSKFIKRMTSAGRVAKDIKVNIVNDKGKTVPHGVLGHIVLQLPYPVGYHNNDVAEKALKRKSPETGEDWIFMSDDGIIDEDGYLYVAGRGVDGICPVHGRTVYSADVEDALQASPLVRSASVAPIKDINGEFDEVVAFVVPASSDLTDRELEEHLRAHCIQELAEWKLPMHYRFLKKMPTNRNNKFDKLALKKSFKHAIA